MDADTLVDDPATGDMPDPGTAPDTSVQGTPNVDPELQAAAVHHSRMATALDAIGNLLGGDKTVHLTKHPDGSLEVTHDPSTGSEKWGRVAAAALSGAAKGFSVGQGPGGVGRAAGAGFEAGQQAQQAPQEAAQAQVDQSQKQLTWAANMAKLHQDYLINQQEMNQRGIKFTNEEADRLNAIEEEMAADPANKKLGNFKGLLDVHSFAALHPEAVPAHLSQGQYLKMLPQADGTTNAYVTSVADGEQMLHNPAPVPQVYIDADGKKATRDIAPTTIRRKDYDLLVQNQTAKNSELSLQYDKQQRDDNPKPKTQAELVIEKHRLLNPNDPTKAATDAAAEIQRNEMAQKTAGRNVTVNPYTPPPGAPTKTPTGEPIIGTQYGGGDPNSSFEVNARLIQQGLKAPSQIKPMRGKGQPTEADYIARADQIDRAQGGTGINPEDAEEFYKTATALRKEYSPVGKTGQKLQAFSTLLEHLGDVHDSVQELRQTGSPYLNKPLNALKKDILGNVNVGPAAIRASAPAEEYKRVLANNQALNNQEKEGIPNLLNENMPLSVQQANSKQMAKTIIDRIDPIMGAYRDNMKGQDPKTQLTPRAVQTLRNMGLYDEAMSRLHPNGQVPAQQPNITQAARQPGPAATFTPAPKQPTTPPPFPGAVFGTGPNGPGWYPPQTGGH